MIVEGLSAGIIIFLGYKLGQTSQKIQESIDSGNARAEEEARKEFERIQAELHKRALPKK